MGRSVGDSKIQVGEFLLDMVKLCRGSLQGIYYEKRSRRKINVGACQGSKDLGTASGCKVMTISLSVGAEETPLVMVHSFISHIFIEHLP